MWVHLAPAFRERGLRDRNEAGVPEDKALSLSSLDKYARLMAAGRATGSSHNVHDTVRTVAKRCQGKHRSARKAAVIVQK